MSARTVRLRRAGLRLLVLLAAGYLLAAGLAFAFQRWLVYPRWLREASAGAGEGLDGLVRLARDLPGDAPVEAWLLLGRGVSADRPGPLVVYLHGNAELIDDWVRHPLVGSYRELGVTVLLPEYRGYGRSAGHPTEELLVEDAAWFLERALARPEVDPARVVYHGRSLGGGVACQLAARRPPRALVLQSTFARLADLAWRSGLPPFLVLDDWDSEAVLASLRVPVLLLHGRRDDLVPFGHAERNLAALRAAGAAVRLAPDDCDHADCPADWALHDREVERLLRGAGILPPL